MHRSSLRQLAPVVQTRNIDLLEALNNIFFIIYLCILRKYERVQKNGVQKKEVQKNKVRPFPNSKKVKQKEKTGRFRDK